MTETFKHYFDIASSTPVDPRVIEAMLPYFHTHFANPNAQHKLGQDAAKAINQSTEKVADLLNMDPKGIVWTSGATESITTSVVSATKYYKSDDKNHILTTPLEHSALAETIKQCTSSVGYLSDLKCSGLINPDEIKQHKKAYMLGTHHVNNEIGVIQPMEEIIDICRVNGIVSCIDATQSLGKVGFDKIPTNADYLTLSCHKAYGPRGIGILYANQKPKRHIESIVFGKSRWHERPGTPSTALIVGFAKALEIFESDSLKRVSELKDCFLKHIHPDIKPNLSHDAMVPHIQNIHAKGVLAPTLIYYLKDFCLATGSACHSENYSASHVLSSLALDESAPRESIRVSFCHKHTEEDIKFFCRQLNETYLKLRSMNP